MKLPLDKVQLEICYKLCRAGMISEEEMEHEQYIYDWWARMEEDWKKSLPKFTPVQLANDFPKEKKAIVQHLTNIITSPYSTSKDRKAALAQRDVIRGKNIGAVTDDMIARAKEYSVIALIDMGHARMNKVSCLWCTSSDAMHVYKDHVYCYSCTKWAGPIDVYMKINSVNFPQAVRAMQ